MWNARKKLSVLQKSMLEEKKAPIIAVPADSTVPSVTSVSECPLELPNIYVPFVPVFAKATKGLIDWYKKPQSFDHRLDNSYYDGINGTYILEDMGIDAKELREEYLKVYRDEYVLKNGGGLPGRYLFPKGLYKHYLLTGDQKSKEAIKLMYENGAFVQSNVKEDDLNLPYYSREVAYAIGVHAVAYKLDIGFNEERYRYLISCRSSHLDYWAELVYKGNPLILTNSPYIRGFMVGLTTISLNISGAEAYDVERLEFIADTLYKKCWNESTPGMRPTYKLRNYDPKLDGPDSWEWSDDDKNAPDLYLLTACICSYIAAYKGDKKAYLRAQELLPLAVPVYNETGQHISGAYIGTLDSSNPKGKALHQQTMPLEIIKSNLEVYAQRKLEK